MPAQTRERTTEQREKLTEAKNYLRVDHDEDDELILALLDAGEEYLRNAGVKPSEDKLYRLAVMLYAATQYEHRDGSQKSDGFSYALQSIILQLRLG